MRSAHIVILALLFCAPVRAEDLTGRLAVGGAVGGGLPMGTTWVRQHADLGPLLGGFLRYGLDKNMSLGLSYDNLGFSNSTIRTQTILLNGYYNLKPDSHWNPNIHLGVGGSDVKHDEIGHHTTFTAKLGAGADYFVHKNVAVGGFLDYLPVWFKQGATHEIHGLLFGATLAYWFNPCRHNEPAHAAVPAPAPVPPPAIVSITLTPASVALAANASQPFSASVSGTPNKAVTWSLEPKLGKITNSGAYTAPAVIAAEQMVTVQATSQADPSKSAISQVKLLAPAKVEVRLAVEFDTAKDVVKPQYDAELQKVAQFLKDYPSTHAEIEGHTDSVGDAEYNRALSQRRADAVRQALISRFGAPADRLTSKGYGPSRPLADNATPAGRAQNRRVVATFTGNK